MAGKTIPQLPTATLPLQSTDLFVVENNGQTTSIEQSDMANAILPSQSGNSGKFLTTNGSTASWGAVNAPQVFDFSSVSNWFFSASLQDAWAVLEPLGTPSNPYAQITTGTADSLTFLQAGKYRVNVMSTIAGENETLAFTDGLTAYGVELSVVGSGQVYFPSKSYRTRMSTASSTADDYTLVSFGGVASDAGVVITFLDSFMISVAVNDQLHLGGYAFNYVAGDEYSMHCQVTIEKVNV